MAYNKKTWESDEVITQEALNNMEDGIAAAHTAIAATNTNLAGKQDALTPGSGITITDNTIAINAAHVSGETADQSNLASVGKVKELIGEGRRVVPITSLPATLDQSVIYLVHDSSSDITFGAETVLAGTTAHVYHDGNGWVVMSDGNITLDPAIDPFNPSANKAPSSKAVVDYVGFVPRTIALRPEIISGHVISSEGSYNTSNYYSVTKPISLKKGDTIIVRCVSTNSSVISVINGDISDYSLCTFDVKVRQGANSSNIDHIYTYTAEQDCNVVVSYRSATRTYAFIHVAKQYGLSNGNYINLSVAAAKEHHYTDGTQKVIEWYLLSDIAGNFFYSKDLNNVRFLFRFEEFEKYSFGITSDGDIVACQLAETLDKLPDAPSTSGDGTQDDDRRTNPYCWLASEGWAVEHIVDFGTGLKPCGWSENIGWLSLNDKAMFCEYTRTTVATTNVWAIVGSPVDASNWSYLTSMQRAVISGEGSAADEVKHYHAICQDPFTGIIYTSTGDTGTSPMIYYSKDNGASFAKIAETPNARKFRSLNITFTKDYAIWGSDQFSPSENNTLYNYAQRVGADNPDMAGVIDAESISEVTLDNPAYVAYYGQTYYVNEGLIVMLPRLDNASTSEKTLKMHAINANNPAEHKEIGTISGKGNPGFRTRYSQNVSFDRKAIFGFCYKDEKMRNYNNVAGNVRNASPVGAFFIGLGLKGVNVSITPATDTDPATADAELDFAINYEPLEIW